MIVLYLVMIAAAVEVIRHYVLIEVFKIDLEKNDRTGRYPNHKYVTGERLIFIIFLIIKFSYTAVGYIPLMWVIFQYGLNLVRPGVRIDHLGRDGAGWEFDDLLRSIDYKIGSTARITLHIILAGLFTYASLIIGR